MKIDFYCKLQDPQSSHIVYPVRRASDTYIECVRVRRRLTHQLCDLCNGYRPLLASLFVSFSTCMYWSHCRFICCWLSVLTRNRNRFASLPTTKCNEETSRVLHSQYYSCRASSYYIPVCELWTLTFFLLHTARLVTLANEWATPFYNIDLLLLFCQ